MSDIQQTGRYKVGCDLYGGGTDMQLQIYEQKRWENSKSSCKNPLETKKRNLLYTHNVASRNQRFVETALFREITASFRIEISRNKKN